MTTTIDIGTLITTTTGLHGGCPHIIGKGITVRRIVTWYKRGLNAEEICDRIGTLTLAEVYAALPTTTPTQTRSKPILPTKRQKAIAWKNCMVQPNEPNPPLH
jgi:uncharacterized protein (DUF433 family)